MKKQVFKNFYNDAMDACPSVTGLFGPGMFFLQKLKLDEGKVPAARVSNVSVQFRSFIFYAKNKKS